MTGAFHSLGPTLQLVTLLVFVFLLWFAPDLSAQAQKNVVFVTSTSYPANLGGVAAYDAQCNVRATAAGLNSVGGNDFTAWMSDATSNAVTRLGVNARGFVRVDGAPVADTIAGLLTNSVLLVTGLPAATRAHSIVVDSAAPNIVHLGNEDGYYDSTNSGANWTALSVGLPNVNAKYINQLSLTGSHRLIAATAGGLYLLNLNSAPPPAVSLVNPATGNVAGGTSVTITGTNFKSGATVKFGGVAATNVSFQNSTTITATTPAHAAGVVDVVVYNPDGQTGTKAAGFTYLADPPMITLQPASQSITSGEMAMLSVTASGNGPLTYQWYVGTSGTTGNPIPGATSSSYTTPPLSNTTSYWVRVSNVAGSVDSTTATITVLVVPKKRGGQTISID